MLKFGMNYTFLIFFIYIIFLEVLDGLIQFILVTLQKI